MKAVNKAVLFSIVAMLVLMQVFINGCTPEKQFHVLSFFFDGVQDPSKKSEITSSNDSLNETSTVKKEIPPEFFVHKPYEEEKCRSCHAEGFSNALIKPLPELCYTCHEDFSTKYKTLHGPVASGNCTMCHNQHMSKLEKLLERPGRQLCLYCHDSKQVLASKMHERIEDKNCTECHSPHGGENRGMLKTGSCYNCHDNFNTKYNYLHGPVASGNCGGCHDSHNSGSPKFLLQESPQLCLSCHESELVYKNPAHKKNRKANCTECHNPHGGADRTILIPSLMPAKGQQSLKMNGTINMDLVSKAKAGNNNEGDTLSGKIIQRK